jgi:hypothetical protein
MSRRQRFLYRLPRHPLVAVARGQSACRHLGGHRNRLIQVARRSSQSMCRGQWNSGQDPPASSGSLGSSVQRRTRAEAACALW